MLLHVMDSGIMSENRTGVRTKKVFGYQWRHNMADGFPLLTTKQMFWRIVTAELTWMLNGGTNTHYLRTKNVTIWDEWADKDGNLGPIYGHQWRRWAIVDRNGDVDRYDQIAEVFHRIIKNPDDRRMIVSAWNVGDLHKMKLPPCHFCFQFGVFNGKLNIHVNMRSADLFLGVPYNIAFYALLLHIFAHGTQLEPGELVMSFTDLHIYENHFPQVWEQLGREGYPLPKVEIDGTRRTPWSYEDRELRITGYKHHPAIKADVAV